MMPPEKITLADLQSYFADSVYKKEDNKLNKFIHARDNLSSKDLLAIYRNNTHGLLKENLELIYPTVLAIVGDDFFKTLAYHYIPLNPSTSGDMHEYGENFADFISHFPAAESLPYLPDVARLEWRWHQVYHAADDVKFDLGKLIEVTPEHFNQLYFSLANASALVQSEYPILDIWQISQAGADSQLKVNLDSGSQNILMLRQNGHIQLSLVSDQEVIFIESLAEGQSFASAFDLASAEQEFDINTSLQKLIQVGLITDCSMSQ